MLFIFKYLVLSNLSQLILLLLEVQGLNRGGFLNSDASPSGLGHCTGLGTLVALNIIKKNSVFGY